MHHRDPGKEPRHIGEQKGDSSSLLPPSISSPYSLKGSRGLGLIIYYLPKPCKECFLSAEFMTPSVAPNKNNQD